MHHIINFSYKYLQLIINSYSHISILFN